MSTETYLILSLIFSSIGLGFFLYGKKAKKRVPLLCGIVLMFYSYFVNDFYLTILIGIGLSALPFFISWDE